MSDIILGGSLVVVCAFIFECSRRKQMREYAAFGVLGGLILVIFGMATAGHG